MQTQIDGFPVRILNLFRDGRQKFVEIMITVHPLRAPRSEIHTIDDLYHGIDRWVRIGFITATQEQCLFLVYDSFIREGICRVGITATPSQALKEMAHIVIPVLGPFQIEPTDGSATE